MKQALKNSSFFLHTSMINFLRRFHPTLKNNNKRMKKHLLVLCTFLLLSNNLFFGQHYTDWTGFEYKTIKPETSLNNEGVYELQKDYTISLPEFFLDQSKMPSKKGQVKDTYRGNAEYYYNWASNLPMVEWDFIRIEKGGILTIKKGYRWDGASNPISLMKHWNWRSSLVHDVLYDLMRMEYLKHDKNHDGFCVDYHTKWGDGDKNRAMADIIHYMIAVEDGDDGAFSDFKVLRKYGACKSSKKSLLKQWKYHVSELAAYATDGKVELEWKRANEAGKYPGGFPIIGYDIMRNGEKIAYLDAYEIEGTFPFYTFTYYTSFTDNTVSNNGSTYSYQLKPHADNDNQDDWSNIKYSVPLNGAGNALQLDGIDDYMEANTTSNDLCFHYNDYGYTYAYTMEAWVRPENQTGKSAILAFNTISGGNYNILMYDGDSEQFCYYDDDTKYIFSPDVYPVDNWYHVAITIEFEVYFDFDGPDISTTGILHVGGEEQVHFTPSIIPKYGARFSIGQEWDNEKTSNFFKGCIDEVRIWNDIRTQDELIENMYQPLKGDEQGLMALWHFDKPELVAWPSADDATVNDNVGTLHGFSVPTFVSSGAMVKPVVSTISEISKPQFILNQNYPNPFSTTTVIKYNLQKSGQISLIVYSFDGRIIETLENGFQLAGVHEINWQPNNIKNGVYYCRLQNGEFSKVMKMILMK